MDNCPTTVTGARVNAAGCEIDSDGDGIVDRLDQCSSTASGSKVDAHGCVIKMDADGDGVADKMDQCPNTPAGVATDSKGCELDSDNDGIVDRLDSCKDSVADVTVDVKGCEIDSDSDGIVDRLDQCPVTVKSATVDAKGCEIDSDNDGIVDSRDQCSNTATGTNVDNKGCELEEIIILKNVTFGSGSSELAGDSKTELDDVAITLKRNSELSIEIGGYTDNRGSVGFNTRLSQQRANSVKAYLVSQGVNSANLKAVGFGPQNPVTTNETAAGRAENRRVELHILK